MPSTIVGRPKYANSPSGERVVVVGVVVEVVLLVVVVLVVVVLVVVVLVVVVLVVVVVVVGTLELVVDVSESNVVITV